MHQERPLPRPPRVLDGPIGGFPRGVEPARHPLDLGAAAPHRREPRLVTRFLQRGDGSSQLVADLLGRLPVRIHQLMREASLEAREPSEGRLTRCRSLLHGLIGRTEREPRFERVAVRPRHLVQHARTIWVSFRKQVGRVPEQCGGCRLVAAFGGAPSACRVMPRRPQADLARGVAQRSELLVQPVRPFQVVGDDLLLFLDAIARHVHDPRRVPLV